MSRYENLWSCRLYLCQCLWRVVARVAADMGHQHIDLFNAEKGEWLEGIACVASIDIALYGTQRFEFGYLIGQLDRADIACVPNLIDIA